MSEPALTQSLAKKSIHELRAMAQAFGVTDIFEKDAVHLIQEIELKHAPQPIALAQLPQIHFVHADPDAHAGAAVIVELLEPFIKVGLKLSFTDDGERWMMKYGKRDDEGTMRMPVRVVLECAKRIMQ